MRKTLLVAAMLLSCSQNPMGINDPVDVYLSLKLGSQAWVKCEGQLVAYLSTEYRLDTITVPDESTITTHTKRRYSWDHESYKAKDGLKIEL